MSEVTNYFGIDISKDVFDVCDPAGKHYQFSNNKKGFKSFYDLLDEQSHSTMEATGCYHLPLANFLNQVGQNVSVINPLVIKRFIQMRLRHTKTDKADAKMIKEYAEKEKPVIWAPRPVYMEDCMENEGVVRLLLKHRTALKNKLHSLKSKGSANKLAIIILQKQVKDITNQIKELEQAIGRVVAQHKAEMLANITSIPGMGRKTALFLIVLTNAFQTFENSNQVSAFIGLAPTQKISGSSIKARSKISKTGNVILRNLLFMCSFTACIHNKACRQLYERITTKGKSKKLALIAVANKLIKQSFAIAKSGMMYDENYRSRKPLAL